MARQDRNCRGVTRRDFLKYSAGAAAALAGGSLLRWPAVAEAGRQKGSVGRKKEARTYFFNFSHMDTSNHDLVLVAGSRRAKLTGVTKDALDSARRRHPILGHVPDQHFTHQVRLKMPADAVQVCWVQRMERSRNRRGMPGHAEARLPDVAVGKVPDHATTGKPGRWDMAHLFHHHPMSALRNAHRRAYLRAGTALPAVHAKWRRYGITPELRHSFADPVGESMLQDTNDQACTLVSFHPELASGEPDSSAVIQDQIATQDSTAGLGAVLALQGPATEGGGWATQMVVTNPDTGEVVYDTAGQISYVPVWSDLTSQYAGQAMGPALDTVKDDTSLGANITDADPTTLGTYQYGADDNAETTGAVWLLHDGNPTVDQSAVALSAAETPAWQFSDQTTGHGFRLDISRVEEADANGNVHVEFEAKNWFVRYLSVFVRYLDSNGQPIPLSTIADRIQDDFELWDWAGSNGTYDAFVDMVAPQWVFLGIPLLAGEIEKSIPVPPEASSILILSGGLGSGDNPYPATVTFGKSMTCIFNLAVPSILLCFAAAAGYNTITKDLEDTEVLREMLEIAIDVFGPVFTSISFENPEELKDVGLIVARLMVSSGAEKLDEEIAKAIVEGEVVDAFPIIGGFFSAIFALNLVAGIAETSAQTSGSPQTYIDVLAFTHDVEVVISHDPKDPSGFPATATHYIVTALFDGSSTRKVRQDMPGTTVTDPIEVRFAGIPSGGVLQVDVAFYSDTGFLVGHGTVGPVENLREDQSLAIEITEVKIPLTADTVYSHKQVTQLDSAGNHVWHGTTTPPPVQPRQCDDINGHICSSSSLTVSTVNASVGYAWKSYNSAVVDCVSGGQGQLHQFANISTTANPQGGYMISACGFSNTTRVVYNLLGKDEWNFYLDGNNFIRQIRLSAGGPSSYDGPASNKAFGRLQLSSDALLLHPLGKIVSINTGASKIEVLDLPPAALPDASAPVAVPRSGPGTREGLVAAPIHAAITAQGTILVLEQDNNRIQAFDLGGNPVPYFDGGAYYAALKDPAGSVHYLDLAAEYAGYLFVLSSTKTSPVVYHLDIYEPGGAWLSRTSGFHAEKVAVNYWRDVYSLNYQTLTLPGGAIPAHTEPSISQWIPSTPSGDEG
jgi:hypothetical protein